ncbi:hypothetical protein GUJ93_ZPchr0301g2758 [Zizania palustris]|uniref:Uncharacterized protein n=1 Tax=Zizania palustris TaxID=103762 RepID=A0A8J5RD12_ZIZPA|nr:hypothetical protein GUJ93_ZPchr0301g2758 [Zizania palustris]
MRPRASVPCRRPAGRERERGGRAGGENAAAPPASADRRWGGEPAGRGDGAGASGEQRRFSRVPSMALERLRSFNMYRLAIPAPEPAVAGVVDLGHEEQPSVAAVERSRSEAAMDADAELPPLPARLRKSASDRSAFAHFQAVTEE